MEYRKVEDIELEKGTGADKLIKLMEASGGFTSKKVAQGVEILENMVRNECTNFVSFPACIVATGARGLLKTLIMKKWFDVVITTCGTIDHDLARSFEPYYHGDFIMDDVELHKEGINRLGNILVPQPNYGGILEEKVQPILQELWDSGIRKFSTKEILWEFGKRLDSDSILYWCSKNEVPIYVPGITDGAFGYQIWSFWQEHKEFGIDLFKDEAELAEVVFKAQKTGGLIIGGGISKHHLLWWNQFKDGLDYAVYITTAPEHDGSLSGAQSREAISWGKLSENASHVTIQSDATVVLPIMVAALLERL